MSVVVRHLQNSGLRPQRFFIKTAGVRPNGSKACEGRFIQLPGDGRSGPSDPVFMQPTVGGAARDKQA